MAILHILQLKPHCGQSLSQGWNVYLYQADATAEREQHVDEHVQLMGQLKNDHNRTGNDF
jgi:hypothetical protein